MLGSLGITLLSLQICTVEYTVDKTVQYNVEFCDEYVLSTLLRK